MSQWDKLLVKILSLSKDLRFDELRKVLESYGYKMNSPLYIQETGMSANYDYKA